jgi:hypothetical protein
LPISQPVLKPFECRFHESSQILLMQAFDNNFIAAHFARMPLVMKQNKPSDPLHIGFLGAVGVMLHSFAISNAIE